MDNMQEKTAKLLTRQILAYSIQEEIQICGISKNIHINIIIFN